MYGPGKLDDQVRQLLPEYMTMGQTGMGEMGEMGMRVPRNSIPMVGGPGPFSYIDMGGMFTIVKVREGITSYEDPGWYEQSPQRIDGGGLSGAIVADEESPATTRLKRLRLAVEGAPVPQF